MDLVTRVPEPELMDTVEQARAYAAADFAEPHEAFVARFRERFPDFADGRVLDLGCGAADVTVRFARAYPGVLLHGIDGAVAMLEEGARRVERETLAHQISLELLRLPDPSLTPQGYDAVISNSLLHHLVAPEVLWMTIGAAAGPGAPVIVMDLRRPPTTEDARRLVGTHAGKESSVLREDFYRSLCAAFTPDEVRGQFAAARLGNLAVEVVSDRHLVVWGAA